MVRRNTAAAAPTALTTPAALTLTLTLHVTLTCALASNLRQFAAVAIGAVDAVFRHTVPDMVIIHCVSKKRIPATFCNNSNSFGSIAIDFDKNNR